MSDTSIHLYSPSNGALSAESYQTFEMAKERDSVIGGDNIAQIRSYAAYARAQAQAIHKTIAATKGLEDVAAIKAEAVETEQTFAKVGIYADQRIGEILRELPKAQGNRNDLTSSSAQEKVKAIQDAGISRSQAYDLQAMAANPDVVQAVLDKAEAEGRIPSRKQVLDAIKERDDARQEVAELERQNDKLYEQANAAKEPKVITRVVDSDATLKRISELERERDIYLKDLQRQRQSNADMRAELDRAKGILGMDKTMQDVRKDVQYLISATNQYVRQYGGLTWTAASLEQVDEPTLKDFRKAVTNLATFANALVACLEDTNGNH